MFLVFCLVSALAQTPAPAEPVAASAAPAALEQLWTTRDVVATRFPDADTSGPSLLAGEAVLVLAREGDKVRIKKGQVFGWVPKDVLTSAAPAPVAPETIEIVPELAP